MLLKLFLRLLLFLRTISKRTFIICHSIKCQKLEALLAETSKRRKEKKIKSENGFPFGWKHSFEKWKQHSKLPRRKLNSKENAASIAAKLTDSIAAAAAAAAGKEQKTVISASLPCRNFYATLLFRSFDFILEFAVLCQCFFKQCFLATF